MQHGGNLQRLQQRVNCAPFFSQAAAARQQRVASRKDAATQRQVAPVASSKLQAASCSAAAAARAEFILCLMPAAFLMPFSIFKRTSGACPVPPHLPLGGRVNFCLSWQSLLYPSPCHFFAPPFCTVYIIMLKFVVPHNIFSVFLCSAPYSLSPRPTPARLACFLDWNCDWDFPFTPCTP